MAKPIVIKKTKKAPAPQDARFTRKEDIETAKDDIAERFMKLTKGEQLKILTQVGVGEKIFTCQTCGKVKAREDFYMSTAVRCKSGIVDICKDCVDEIVYPTFAGQKQKPSKETIDEALFYLDKPFLNSVWDSSVMEMNNSLKASKKKSQLFYYYIKNIQMTNYYTLGYRQSDNYTGGLYSVRDAKMDALPEDREILEQFEKNKDDTLRLLGYLPFEKEKISDQPFLYSQLIGFLDASESGNEDMMRVSSIISIVRGFLQISQSDDMIAALTQDTANVDKNIATVKALQEMKKNITLHITKLAEQSCISLKNSKDVKKGDNSWTGKIKKIKELNLRAGYVNGFDIATCRGMQQVQEISDASIMKQLQLDESEWSDMVAEMRKTIVELRKKTAAYQEINRILLQENLDLKDILDDNHIEVSADLKNLKDLYSVFSNDEEEEDEEDIDETDESEDDEEYDDYSSTVDETAEQSDEYDADVYSRILNQLEEELEDSDDDEDADEDGEEYE